MLVQDPSSANDVDAIFNQAGQAGAVQRPIDYLPPSSSSRSFTGMGRLLSGETVSSTPQPPASITHNIIFWSNGFTVDDGPLRRLDDPENASFLEVISKPSIWDSGLILMILSLQDLAVEFAPRSTLSITCCDIYPFFFCLYVFFFFLFPFFLTSYWAYSLVMMKCRELFWLPVWLKLNAITYANYFGSSSTRVEV